MFRKKGSDDVCSMLHKFVYDELDERVRKLEVFCDGFSGQNKNYTLVRFFHNLVHTERRFDLITASFPVRGHSYLETDKNLGLINQKTRTELPHDWIEVFETARTNPSPFIVHEATIDTFRQWTAHLAPFYKKKCPFATRPVREIVFEINLKKEVKFRTSFNGAFELASITTMDLPPHGTNEGEFNLPNFSYEGLLPIPLAKYQNLQALKKFCGPQAQEYYGSLPHE
ncbi:hypothetical protein J6590_024363 [Homalodisca vitripennis]|nr:hypothetical protein J6590_024363 [Homalodisca vitripennis]